MDFGCINDQAVYTAETVAKLIGRNVKFTKQLLRDNFEITDFGGGLILVSGVNLRLGVERLSRFSTDDSESQDTPDQPPRSPKRRPRSEAQ